MKYIYIVGVVILGSFIFSCSSGQNKNKSFNPTERTSSLSLEEHDQRLANLRAKFGVDLDSLVSSHGVKLSIVMPEVQGDITEEVSKRMAIKMLQMASQNGISGLGTNPNFVLGAEISQTGRAATGTAPQKMTVQYEMTFKVMNAVTGDVYGTSMQEVQGVGNSFEEASLNAVKEIKNTPQIQKFLQTANDRIVRWYDGNLQVVKNQVHKAEGEGNYELALALLNSIPEQSTSYKYVAEKQDALFKAILHKHAAEQLAKMESALASSGDEFDPAISAYLSMIPADCPEHKAAQKMYAEYERKCNARRAALEAKAERDEQAERELQKFKINLDNQNVSAQKIVETSTTEYQTQATVDNFTGQILGGLGKYILGALLL